MQNKKVLIFGSNGLVGSSSTKIFLESNNYEVFASTRKDTDLFKLGDTQKIIDDFSPDVIINCAAKVGGIMANNSLRTEFILENLKININIFESCIKKPNISIINLGSSCIYPLNAPNPIKESSFMEGKLEETNSPYAMAKLTAIEIGNAMHLEYGHKVINLMPTNLYGPNDYFSELNSHVIPGLIMRMHKAKLNNDKEFLIWGSGNPLREFLHVDDLAKAIDTIIKSDTSESLINVGSAEEISIKELAQIIKSIVGYEGELNFDSSKPDGNPRKLLDSTKMYQLGWRPEINLKSGLKDTYKWFVENTEL